MNVLETFANVKMPIVMLDADVEWRVDRSVQHRSHNYHAANPLSDRHHWILLEGV